ncbi:hypothetical protein CQA57_05685 [Helicobacter anseris]|uniref:Uncharacterized protein n=1 Tax=Helicobacter anseris TaxID=375926 RepID=A0A3D8J7C0_9HELI|nr:hypothetical protein [Helicobacter anseris]RDU73016.1 hypothetical protein CQA57_05685 [Helicobacter anseris]
MNLLGALTLAPFLQGDNNYSNERSMTRSQFAIEMDNIRYQFLQNMLEVKKKAILWKKTITPDEHPNKLWEEYVLEPPIFDGDGIRSLIIHDKQYFKEVLDYLKEENAPTSGSFPFPRFYTAEKLESGEINLIIFQDSYGYKWNDPERFEAKDPNYLAYLERNLKDEYWYEIGIDTFKFYKKHFPNDYEECYSTYDPLEQTR